MKLNRIKTIVYKPFVGVIHLEQPLYTPVEVYIGTLATKEENMPAYPYKPKTAPAALAFALFSVLTMVSVSFAFSNHGGLIINRVVHLNSGLANILLFLISALFGYMSIISLLSLKNSFSSSRWVELENDQLSIPKSGHSNSIVKIKTAHIKGISLQEMQKYQLLKIKHIHGVTIMHSGMFPSETSFDRMCESIKKISNING